MIIKIHNNNSNAINGPLMVLNHQRMIKLHSKCKDTLSKHNYILTNDDPYVAYTVNFYEPEYFITWHTLFPTYSC
jgi:hypothetical protein